MKTIKTARYFATLALGLKRGYTDESIAVEDVYDKLSIIQDELIQDQGVYLSANCTESGIVMSGQREPHLNIRFINYPRFPLDEDTFKETVTEIASQLQSTFDQNRVVIEFHDSFVMIQGTCEIDPSIIRK